MLSFFYRTILGYLGFERTKLIPLQNVLDGSDPNDKKQNLVQWDVSKERLTAEKFRNYFGVNYDGIMYYDFDNRIWKSDRCLGHCMPYQDQFEDLMWEFKVILEQEPLFVRDELVAVVTMVVKDRFFAGVAQRVTHPFFARGGTGVVGTIIRRDRETGKLLPIPCSWNGVALSKLGACDAIWYGPKWFAKSGIENQGFRHALLKNHCRFR